MVIERTEVKWRTHSTAPCSEEKEISGQYSVHAKPCLYIGCGFGNVEIPIKHGIYQTSTGASNTRSMIVCILR